MDSRFDPTIMEFVLYNNWANQQVLQACQNLSEEQLETEIPGAYGTIRDTLEHIIRGEVQYVTILTGSCPQPLFKWEDRPHLDDMTAFAREVGKALVDMAQCTLPTDQVVEEDGGEQYRYQALALFIQIISHGIEHRTNITTMLNQSLGKPPDIDSLPGSSPRPVWADVIYRTCQVYKQKTKGGNMTTPTQPNGYLATTPTGNGPGVLVLHAWWGLNDTIRTFCDKFAENGFTVFAPDLYHGKVAETIPQAEALGTALDENYQQARAEIAEAAKYLSNRVGGEDRGLAVIGFSLGAFYALDLAAEDPDRIRSVVLYYGTGEGDFSSSNAAFLGHFAGEDDYEPQENVDALEESLKAAGRPVTFYRYPGAGHWFCEPDRTDAYDEKGANLAWERTLDFLRQ